MESGRISVMVNEYDNEKFFDQYAKMPRSKEGLSAAGEWHQLKPLFPLLQGKSFLDLGCGYGWHCKFAEEQGASRILGIDLSQKMIEEAERRNSGKKMTEITERGNMSIRKMNGIVSFPIWHFIILKIWNRYFKRCIRR